ncbi:unnamed protein product [Bursaphelenchus xylophilus]|uniref:(pine wood nematode) hypothetical protein n=1 Tax=Bursaphelenchus xylophilus TaxID=6326 RepID=A0A1I7SD31_BURXY|nr:unnamed protein product [Bursaphelenchus xylophilus]CAG9093026.1 unnamed protein product [Bursaphelenchus xylophilus]
MLQFAAISALLLLAAADKTPVKEPFCRPNQVVNKVTVFDDGAIEAECGPIPCGQSGAQCSDDLPHCKSEADNVFSGMRWSKNGQSILLRCCSINVPNKVYVGTDLVSTGSYYTGGLVGKKDMFGKAGPEFDYVSNIRAEQGGVRIWVYRIMCPVEETKRPEFPPQPEPQRAALSAEQRRQNVLQQLNQQSEVGASVDAPVEEEPANPLQYRPPARMARQKDSPMHASRRVL